MAIFSEYSFWLGLLSLGVASYAAYLQRRQYSLQLAQMTPSDREGLARWWKYPPLVATTVLALLTWGPFAYNLAVTPSLPSIGVISWGGPLNSMQITAGVSKADQSVRLIAVAFHYDGLIDVLDVDQLQKSSAYDVRLGVVVAMIKPDETFVKETTSGQHGRTNYVLLTLPAANSGQSFKTLRQAFASGAKQIWAGIGPP